MITYQNKRSASQLTLRNRANRRVEMSDQAASKSVAVPASHDPSQLSQPACTGQEATREQSQRDPMTKHLKLTSQKKSRSTSKAAKQAEPEVRITEASPELHVAIDVPEAIAETAAIANLASAGIGAAVSSESKKPSKCALILAMAAKGEVELIGKVGKGEQVNYLKATAVDNPANVIGWVYFKPVANLLEEFAVEGENHKFRLRAQKGVDHA